MLIRAVKPEREVKEKIGQADYCCPYVKVKDGTLVCSHPEKSEYVANGCLWVRDNMILCQYLPCKEVITWKRIVDIYKKTQTPSECVEELLNQVGLEDSLQTLAVIVKLRSHDGRYSKKNKEFLNNVETSVFLTEWTSDNPMRTAGLDDIHPTHVDQIITEFRRRWPNGK